jgi:hypothetical protein
MTRRVAVASVLLLALAAAPSAAGAQPAELPRVMPSFNQAYTDGPDAWGRAPLGTDGCPDRVATTGCLVSSLACVLAYYGISVEVPRIASWTGRSEAGMNPGILNDWLRSHNGYDRCSEDPVGDCCLDWDSLPEGVELTWGENPSDVSVSPRTAMVVDRALREGHPVVAGVHWSLSCRGGATQGEDCHWVVVTGKAGTSYAIVDPYNDNASSSSGVRTTLAAGVKGSYVIDRFVVVSPAAPKPMPVEVRPAETRPDASPSGAAASLLVLLAAIAIVVVAVFAMEADR